jgi:hypothetical protein
MFLISLVALLGLVNSTYAIDWDGGGADDSFCTPENWDGDVVPGPGQEAYMEYRTDGENLCVVDCAAEVGDWLMPAGGGSSDGPTTVNIVSGGSVVCDGGEMGDGGYGYLNLSGTGSLTSNDELRFFDDGDEGWLTIADDAAIVVYDNWRMGDGDQTVHIDVSGGTIYTDGYWRLGDDGGGTVNISGGSINCGGEIRWICRGASQTITVSGGEQWSGDSYQIGHDCAGGETCDFTMTGGIINADQVRIHAGSRDGTVTAIISGGLMVSRGRLDIGCDYSVNDTVSLCGTGVIEASDIQIKDGAVMDINDDGTLILEGNKLATVGDLANAGKLTGCGSERGVVADYGVTNPGKTTVTSTCDIDICKAWAPTPADGATEVQSVVTEVVLEWKEGDCLGTRGRNALYFGTDEAAVAAATPTDPEFVQYHRAGEFTHNIGNLPLWETRYWKVDELNSLGGYPPQTDGDVWSFTTGCAAIAGDINLDCLVNFLDYAELANSLGQE